jgi:HK97 family phage portal protein
MGLWNWLKGGEFRASGLASPANWVTAALGVTGSYSGEKVTVERALELAAVRSAVAMVSQAVGSLPLKVYRLNPDTDERMEARNHRTWRMLHDKPNEHCTAEVFWTATAAQLLVYENSLIYKQRSPDFEVESLHHLDLTQWKVEITPLGKQFIFEGPPRKVYSEDEVLHIVGFSLDGYYGSARITQAKQTLGTALARAKFEGSFYKSGAKIPGVLEHPGRVGEAGVKSLAEQFSRWHGGAENMHKVPVLEEGMAFKGVSMSLEDMQFAELAEQTRTEIAVLFNIPPAYLGATTGDSLTYATTESNSIQFAQMAVLPVANKIAKALSSDPAILPWNVMYCEFVLEGLLRADMKTRMEYWKGMKEVLGLDPEYIAARENIPKDALKKPEPVPSALASPLDRDGELPAPQPLRALEPPR